MALKVSLLAKNIRGIWYIWEEVSTVSNLVIFTAYTGLFHFATIMIIIFSFF